MTARTAHLSIRLHDSAKEAFAVAAEKSGMDASVAARQVIEMLVKRLERGGDLIDVMYDLKRALGVADSEPPPSLLERVERLEEELHRRRKA